MSSDAIVLLKADHREVRRLFREFQAAGDAYAPERAEEDHRRRHLLTTWGETSASGMEGS